MSDVISFLTSLLFIACLIYVPICAIVVLARSLATPGEGKMTKEDERFGKLFSWHYLFWAVYALLILFCIGSADCHPVHDGMTEAESKILCWKALLAGPYAGRFLPCVPKRFAEVTAVVLAAFRKWRLALYSFATFALVWLFMATGALWYWK